MSGSKPYNISVSIRMLRSSRTAVPCKALVVEVTLTRPITPEEAGEIADTVYAKVIEENRKHLVDTIAVSGRMPIWAYGMILHAVMHLAPIIAVYDPKQHGYIVIATHTPAINTTVINRGDKLTEENGEQP